MPSVVAPVVVLGAGLPLRHDAAVGAESSSTSCAMAVLEAGQRVRVRGKSGFLLVQNANGTWTVDYDDNTEEDLAADEIEVVGPPPPGAS